RLRPGTRLVFSQVASRFGVSPIPVREAVRQLETEGLVQLKPHTRVEVTALPWEQGVGAYELRMVLEPIAAKDATPLLTDGALARQSGLLEDMRAALDRGDADAFTAAYYALFDVVYKSVPYCMLVQTLLERREVSKRIVRVHRCDAHVLRGSENALRRV